MRMPRLVLLVILTAAVSSLAPAATGEFSAFSVTAEQAAMDQLGMKFTEPGNAAEIYYQMSIDNPCHSTEILELSTDSMIAPANDQEREKRAVALAQAEQCTAAIQKASRMRDYAMWGTVYQPDPQANAFDAGTPNYSWINELAITLIPRAKAAAAAGDFAAAEEKLLALVNVGRHLQTDPTISGWGLGLRLKRRGATALVELYKSQGRTELAQKWSDYLQRMEVVREAFREVRPRLAKTSDWTREKVTAFVHDPDLPAVLKVELLLWQSYCLDSRARAIRCSVLGPPEWVVKLRREIDDPQAQVLLKLMGNRLTFREAWTFVDYETSAD